MGRVTLWCGSQWGSVGEIGDQIRFVLRSVHVYVWAMADGGCGLIVMYHIYQVVN